jgi:subtilisin family serine protease
MRSGIIVLLALIALSGAATAQSGPALIDPAFAAWIAQHRTSVDAVDLYVHGEVQQVAQAVRDVGGHVKMVRPGTSSVRVPVDAIPALATAHGVRGLDFDGSPGMVLNDSMRVTHRVNQVHQGLAPLPHGWDGRDVVVGIIDAGLDLTHPDMRLPDGRTRVLRYWDQTKPVNTFTPAPYGYGQAWDSTQINAGLSNTGDQTPYFGHGTVVTGTAAGNGGANGRHRGVAPAADLVIVSVNMSAGNFRARVADAVHYILQAAAAVGKPAVINASVGTYLGSHDGLDPSTLFIDDMLLEQPGRIMVCAAGNSNNQPPYHLRTEVTADTTFTWFLVNNSSELGGPAVYFEVWADQPDLDQVLFAVGADRATPSLQYRGRTPFRSVSEAVGQVLTDTLWSHSGNRLGVVQYAITERGDQYRMQVVMQQPDSASYRFRFLTTGQGRFDVWSHAQFGTSTMVTNIPSPTVYPPMAHYVLPDNDQHIVDAWACSPHVITVGNHYGVATYMSCEEQIVPIVSAPGAIAVTSSKGPTRTDLTKPDISATGDVLLSSCPLYLQAGLVANEPFKLAQGCMHVRNGGTSQASPVVTGTVALLLEQCPYATPQSIREALAAGAVADAFTGEVPNSTWGHGKLDAFASMVAAMAPPVTVTGPNVICTGTSVELSASGDHVEYLWSDGRTGPTITVETEGPLSVMAISAWGCVTFGDTLHISVVPGPPTPSVVVDGGLLSTVVDDLQYQWSLDGAPIPGANAPVWHAQTSGLYTVTITDAQGCSATSAPEMVVITGLANITPMRPVVWPSPVQNVLQVRTPSVRAPILRLLDAQGRVVIQHRLNTPQDQIDVARLAGGTYTVLITSDEGSWSHRVIKLP